MAVVVFCPVEVRGYMLEDLQFAVDNISGEPNTTASNITSWIAKHYLAELHMETVIFDMVAEAGVVDEDFSKTVMVVYVPLGISMEETESLVNTVNSIASSADIPHNGQVSQLTGQDAINVAINKKLTDEQTRSMIIAILLVLATLIIIFGSSIYGFLTMIPVAFVLMWEPGFLVALDIPLSVVTISIASIMIGIGIDYGVHITHRVREEMARHRGIVDIQDDVSRDKQFMEITLDEAKGKKLGIDQNHLVMAVQAAFHGLAVATYNQGDDNQDVKLKYLPEYRHD